MNAVLDNLLIAAVLLVSCCYALLKLGPGSLRRSILRQLSLILAAAPASWRLAGIARRLATASGKAPAACGGCDSCGSESASAAPPPSEINVPIGKIGRRT